MTLSTNQSAAQSASTAQTAAATAKTYAVGASQSATAVTGMVTAATSAAEQAAASASAAQEAASSAGIGLASTAITYQVGTSGTTPPTGTWLPSVPATAQGQWLWTRTVLTYTDATTATLYSAAYQGTNGAPGTGVTVSSSAITYQSSVGGTTPPTGTWTTAVPAVAKGSYLWTRTIVTYSDTSTSTSYSAAYQGVDGASGVVAPGAAASAQILAWATSEAFQFSAAVPTTAGGTAAIAWPDGTAGVFTADTISATYGSIDAWHATYVGTSKTSTATQPAVTRDAYGNVTTQPAITVA